MSYSKIITIIDTANQNLANPLPFDQGRAQDINIFDGSNNTLLWFIPGSINPSKTKPFNRLRLDYEVELFVFEQGQMHDTNQQSLQRINRQEEVAIKLVKNIEEDLTNLTFTPVYLYTTPQGGNGPYTGIAITFNITIDDEISIC
mgnify:CR=1 FL=1